ncbi:DUF397 domain-containing protein [Streptomyces sp. JJ36]|uniref:DUF397 domain-containing protein n=1 Tax=Streptomyces sp. JJ36 TaxID=2736645 RepID=UPI001F24458E|nr:DUF397 domain-containing protein [Streptomyces sp. JJ36]MCF6525013.1 DUF397 domain-containing protein [Streptomyces sp. JJ36]
MSSVERDWFKSSYSGGSGDSCVEVAASPGVVHVRDSKVDGGPELGVGALAWASFVEHAARDAQTGVR